VFLPDKESNALLSGDPGAAFAAIFARAKPEWKTGEVCPDYTKPVPGERALAAAVALYARRTPPKLIYLVREPISRLLSHHYFVSTQHGEANPGGMTADIEASLRDFPELVETSQYASRLRPWMEAFGKETVMVLRFEDYVEDRGGTLAKVGGFIGLPAAPVGGIDFGKVYNPGGSRPIATPAWRRILRQPIYRQCLRPLLSQGSRDRLRGWLLPKPPPRPAPPKRESLLALAEALQPEVEALSRLIGADRPLWDLEAAVHRMDDSAGKP
jgi:hypothetical protein